mmetsp:Transcript_120194/g.256504  ORF Transcript_120194/g.256504 Transcript_120194/m.256504 type:complete len:213 (+) Transcript_120194:62-700(+)
MLAARCRCCCSRAKDALEGRHIPATIATDAVVILDDSEDDALELPSELLSAQLLTEQLGYVMRRVAESAAAKRREDDEFHSVIPQHAQHRRYLLLRALVEAPGKLPVVALRPAICRGSDHTDKLRLREEGVAPQLRASEDAYFLREYAAELWQRIPHPLRVRQTAIVAEVVDKVGPAVQVFLLRPSASLPTTSRAALVGHVQHRYVAMRVIL